MGKMIEFILYKKQWILSFENQLNIHLFYFIVFCFESF
jgi:hypothetical protein